MIEQEGNINHESSEEAKERRQKYMDEIRLRSSKSTNQMRREHYDGMVADYKRRGRSKYGGKPPELFEKEDKLLDDNLITSADLLDLHLALHEDFKKFGVDRTHATGTFSERTEAMIDKIVISLIWGIERFAKEDPKFDFMIYLKKKYLSRLQEAKDYSDKLRLINNILGEMHANATGNEATGAQQLVRDLQLAEYAEPRRLLDFLSNEIK